MLIEGLRMKKLFRQAILQVFTLMWIFGECCGICGDVRITLYAVNIFIKNDEKKKQVIT